jgi:hypothetical protein
MNNPTADGREREAMTTIKGSDFASELGRDGGAINVNDLSPEMEKALADAGVPLADLRKVAGADGQIKGDQEWAKLFKVVDRFDSDGDPKTFLDRDTAGTETKAGALYGELKDETDRYRLAAQTRGIIHFGMRPESYREADKLATVNPAANGGVHRIAGDYDGGVSFGGANHDLTTRAGCASFKAALVKDGMPAAQADELMKVVDKQVGKARDEIALLGVSLWQVGTGDIPADRLVLSGHQNAGTLWGGDTNSPSENEIALDTVGELAAIFTDGANKIEHLALSACNCGDQADIDKYRTWFPNLDSVWAYDGFSPKAEGGAPKQLATWESLTDGDDPSVVDPKYDSVSTWNRRDGFRVHP